MGEDVLDATVAVPGLSCTRSGAAAGSWRWSDLQAMIPGEISVVEGRLFSSLLRRTKTTGATRRIKELPVAISERAFFDWLVVFGLLKGHAGYQRLYLLLRMKENGTLEKMATYADAMVTTARPPRWACRLWLEAIGPNTARGRCQLA